MELTSAEVEAAQRLSQAMLQFIVALEQGKRTRKPAPAVQRIPEEGVMHEPTELAVSKRKAAEMLSISVKTLWSMTTPRGPIRALRIGRGVRYPLDELRRWISENMRLRNCRPES